MGCAMPYEASLKVRFYEVDSYGVAWHGYYVAWFEVARNEFASRFGLDPTQLRQLGLMAPVVELRCNFKLPARYDDVITIEVDMERCETAKLIFHYTAKRGQDVLATGSTTHVLTDLRGVMLYHAPDGVKERLEQMFAYLGR